MVEDKETKVKYNETFNYNLWKEYLQFCDELHVISRIKISDNKLLKRDNKNISSGENVYFYPVSNYTSISSIFNLANIRKEIEQVILKVDAVIIRVPSFISTIAVSLVHKHNKPYIIEVVGYAFDALWNQGTIMGKILAPCLNSFTKKIIREGSNVLYVTEEFLQKKYPTKGKNSIGCSDVVIPSTENFVLEKRLNKINNLKNKEIYTIGLIGSMNTNYKGIDVIIESMKLLEERGVFLNLRILGEGKLKQKYIKMSNEKLKTSKVYFDGVLSSGAEVFNWLDDIDIYVQPSLTEGLPRALIEAISRGLPAIGSNVGGIPELLGQRFIFTKKDYIDLSAKIEIFINNPNLMSSVATENFNNSKKYTKPFLKTKRDKFWEIFLLDTPVRL